MTELQELERVLRQHENDKRRKGPALRLAAPAPMPREDEPTAEEKKLERDAYASLARLRDLIEQWAWWAYTRRYFTPLQRMGISLGALTSRTRAFRKTGGPDAACSSQLFAFNQAIGALRDLRADDPAARVFVVHYVQRPANIKAAADRLGMSRAHYYRLLDKCCLDVLAAAARIEADNLAAGAALPHAPQRLAA